MNKSKIFSSFLKILILFFFIQIISVEAHINVFNPTNPILQEYLITIRNPSTDRPTFRRSIGKIGEYLAIEISKNFNTREKGVLTCMNEQAYHNVIDEDFVIVTVFRAGMPFFDGMMNIFPNAEGGFFALKRNETTLKAEIFYEALPDITNKTVILTDVMIATGGSILDCIELLNNYSPKEIIIAGIIVAQDGIDRIKKSYPDIKIYAASIDPCLNEIGYIVPGLGDAGDRAFGTKIDH